MKIGGVALTTRGRCLLAGGIAAAICAVLLDERDLLRVGIFAVIKPQDLHAMIARPIGIQPHDGAATDHLPPVDVEIDCILAVPNAHRPQFSRRFFRRRGQIALNLARPGLILRPARPRMIV